MITTRKMPEKIVDGTRKEMREMQMQAWSLSRIFFAAMVILAIVIKIKFH